jgi:glutamate/aspartate transport system substrate-binding protein
MLASNRKWLFALQMRANSGAAVRSTWRCEPLPFAAFASKLVIAIAAIALVPHAALAQELTGTLKKIKETGSITIGHRDASIPFSYLDDKQQPVGFALEICSQVVDAIKTELKLPKIDVKYALVTSANRIPLMANGTIDLECGSTTNNIERQKQVSFTNSHFVTASRYVTKKSSKITKIDDLKGKTVVSTSGSTNIKQLNDVNNERKLGINVLPANGHAEAFLMVETDRAVAFVMDDIIIAGLVASSKTPEAYELPSGAFSLPEPYGIMLRRDDPDFKRVVDAATSKLYKSAEIEKLYTKWFQSPIPPKSLNLNLPMAPALKKAFQTPLDSGDPASY